MQQTPNELSPDQSETDNNLLEIDFSVLIKAVMTRKSLVGIICGSVIVLALAYCFLSTPIYEGTCRMLVEPGNLKLTSIQDVYDSEVARDSKGRDSFLMTQMELIQSEHILARVFEHFKMGEMEQFASLREPLKTLRKLYVIKQVPNTNLIDIGFKWPEASFSAQVVNYTANLYMEDSRQRATGFSERGLEKLQDELVDMEARRLKDIQALNAYKEKHNILSVEAAQSLGIQRLTKLDDARVAADEALAVAQASVSSIEIWRTQGKRLDSIPEAIQNPTLTAFKLAKLEAQSKLMNILIDFGPDHKSARIQQQIISDMNKSIANEVENSLVSAQAKLEQAKIRVEIVNTEQEKAYKELMALDLIADEYRMLDDRLKASENAYRLVLQRVNELHIAKSADSGSGGTFQILVAATPPHKAAYPQKAKVMIIATLAALMFSIMLCIVLELLDTRIQKKNDLEMITKLPVFGFIPHAVRPEDAAYDLELIALHEPRGQLAESFRALRTSQSLAESSRKARLLAITSSVEGEGKSFLSLNIAIAHAQAGKRVLLVDMDLRRQRLSHLLNAASGTLSGVSNILAEAVALTDVQTCITRPIADVAMDFLASGPIPPNPAELLGSEHTAELITVLLNSYDLIVFDVPPLLAVTDARTLAAIPSMRFFVVVRMLRTDKRQLHMAMDVLHTVNAQVVGTIMNDADVNTGGHYGYGYGYGYGYNYKYYSYGYGNEKKYPAESFS